YLRHTQGRAPAAALSNYIDAYLATSHRDDRAHSCPLAALSGDLPNMPALAGPLRGRHRATGCRFGEAREEVVREECRGARLVGTGRNGGGARAVANRLRRRQVDANPAEFARDGSIAPRPRSTDITRGVTAPDALTRGSSLSHVRHGVGLPTGPRSDIR